jgi:hypothetical protein
MIKQGAPVASIIHPNHRIRSPFRRTGDYISIWLELAYNHIVPAKAAIEFRLVQYCPKDTSYGDAR